MKKKISSQPDKSVSVIMATLNAGPILEKCLKSVRRQNYDQKKIQIVVADGGSTDDTITIVEKYNGVVVHENTGSPEAAKAYALKKAKNEIILEIDCDNILPNRYWLAKMVSCLVKGENVVGCYTWRYTHRRQDKILNRYFSLFGANDPVAWFLGRADRQSYLTDQWQLAGQVISKTKNSYIIKHDIAHMPTLGANGFLINRKTLLKARVDPKHFYHIDVNYDLIKKGFNCYVVVKNDVIHASGESFPEFFKKRKRYMENLYLRDLNYRRFLLYRKDRDRSKIILYAIYSLTIVGPTFHAVCGYRRIPDPAWFLHPAICFIIFWIYFLSVINWQTWNYLGIIRKKLNL